MVTARIVSAEGSVSLSSTMRSTAALAVLGLALSACGGGSGSGGGGGPPTSVAVSGQVLYERPGRNSNGTLNYGSLSTAPVRGVAVQLIDIGTNNPVSGVGTLTTDASGNFTATVPGGTTFKVRVRAQLVRTGSAPTFDFQVKDNRAANALYVVDGPSVSASGASVTANVTAPTCRQPDNSTTCSPIPKTRPAAPFAILDTIYQAKELIVQAEGGGGALPALEIFWSPDNRNDMPTGQCAGVPNPTTGDIGTTFYLDEAISEAGCPVVAAGMYVLGDATLDSGDVGLDADEFDGSVIAHELGHYYEDVLSRSDSLGGGHGLGDLLDPTVAFSEGWGNAFSSLVRNDPAYVDTFTAANASAQTAFSFNVETDNQSGPEGWFSEESVQELIWDAFDTTSDGADTVSLGFAPIHDVMKSQIRTTKALVGIHAFMTGLVANNASVATSLQQLRAGESIGGTDDFAAGENNGGGVLDGAGNPGGALPIFATVSPGSAPVDVWSTSQFPDTEDPTEQSYNRIGARRYVKLPIASAGSYLITLQTQQFVNPAINGLTTADSDPDFTMLRNGVPVDGCEGLSGAAGTETLSCSLAADTYVVEVRECGNIGQFACGPGSIVGDARIRVTVN
jgi:hypothetical protein